MATPHAQSALTASFSPSLEGNGPPSSSEYNQFVPSALQQEMLAALSHPSVIDALAKRLEIGLQAQWRQVVEAEIAPLKAGLTDQINRLRDQLEELGLILRAVSETTHESAAQIDITLSSMQQQIEMTKVEIAGIRHPNASEDQLSLALFELDAIITATHSATTVILNAAEHIMGLTHGDSSITAKDLATEMNAQVLKIFEACNFQDLTGQRVTKVVETFLKIEEHLNSIIRGLGREAFNHIPVDQGKHASRDGTVLTGPANVGFGTSQQDIDSLFD
jgi:Chemotaxis phosphatase, CheZ